MKNVFASALTAALVCACFYALRPAEASRNSSGTMSAINGPYISGTPISSSVINARFADLEAEITDSLSRSGKGAMTAALKEADGTVAAPSYSFGNDTGSGFYRIGANNIGWAINGVKRLDCSTTGCVVTGTFSATSFGASTFTSTLGVTGAATFSSSVATNGVTGTPIGLTTHGGSTATLTNVQQLVTSNAIAIESTYTADNYLPGLVWYTADENPTKPKAAIWVRSTATGSHLMLGTSNAYATGVTNTGIDLDQAGKATIAGAVAIGGALAVTGASTLTGALAANGGVTIGASGTASTQANFGSCATSGGTPSTCTATVVAAAKCVSAVNEAAYSGDGCSWSLSGTTLTLRTSGGIVHTCSYACF